VFRSETYSLAGLVMAGRRTVRCSPAGLSAAETTMLVSITSLIGIIPFRFPGTRGFDYPLDLARGQLVGMLSLRFLADNPKHVRLRGGEADMIPDAEQYRLGRAGFSMNEWRSSSMRRKSWPKFARARAVRTRPSSPVFRFSAW